ncbi:MAG: ATP-binding cassette domain-containing protein [Candidatus Heimdallarchaeota archaeon]
MVDHILQSNALVKEFPTGVLSIGKNKGKPSKKRILDGITFDLQKGLSLALLGPNGSGKTTRLKTLSTIYSPDGGGATVCGYDIVSEIKEVRKRISFVTPSMDFQKKLTLKQTLDFFVKVTGGDMALAKDFIEELQLDHLWNTKLETFSEGQKAITRLCVGLQKNPEILFADEVTNGIDFRRKQVVLDFLEKQGRERTLVLVDHDPEVVDVLCDKILLIALGGTVRGMVDVAELHSEFNYMYDIMVIPKGPVSKKEAKDIWPRFEMIGGMCRFFASNRDEATEIHERVIKWGNFIDIKTSGISIEDITLLWLKKHEDELEVKLQEARKKAKEKELALAAKKELARSKRRKKAN